MKRETGWEEGNDISKTAIEKELQQLENVVS